MFYYIILYIKYYYVILYYIILYYIYYYYISYIYIYIYGIFCITHVMTYGLYIDENRTDPIRFGLGLHIGCREPRGAGLAAGEHGGSGVCLGGRFLFTGAFHGWKSWGNGGEMPGLVIRIVCELEAMAQSK